VADERWALLRRALIVAVIAEHILLVIAPLDVLHPVDPWVLGRAMWHGHIPYRDFGFEYPPFAAFAFLLPGAVTHGLAPSVLALQEVVAEAAVIWLVLRDHPTALTRYLVLSLLVFPFLSGGFDALPMAAIALSTLWLATGDARGWVAAGLGVLVKVSPGAAWLWGRTHLRVALTMLAATAVVGLAPLAIAHHADDTYIGYTIDRGVQVESVPASAAWIGQTVTGHPHHYAYRFKSWELGGAGPVAAVCVVAGALALVVLFAACRRRLDDPWLASLVAVVAFMCAAKVLSPQYVAWAAPVAAVVGGGWFVAYAAAAALTFLAYAATSGPTGIIVLSALRNAVLIAIAIAGLVHLVRSPDATEERA